MTKPRFTKQQIRDEVTRCRELRKAAICNHDAIREKDFAHRIHNLMNQLAEREEEGLE